MLAVKPVLAPLPYIAAHVAETQSVWLEKANRGSGNKAVRIAKDHPHIFKTRTSRGISKIARIGGRWPLCSPGIDILDSPIFPRGQCLRLFVQAHGNTPLGICWEAVLLAGG